jgi:hypothetical protein
VTHARKPYRDAQGAATEWKQNFEIWSPSSRVVPQVSISPHCALVRAPQQGSKASSMAFQPVAAWRPAGSNGVQLDSLHPTAGHRARLDPTAMAGRLHAI